MKSTLKLYRKSFSVRLDDGSMATTTFGTELFEDGADPAELFEEARRSTEADMKAARKIDPLDRFILKKIADRVKKIKKAREALEDLD